MTHRYPLANSSLIIRQLYSQVIAANAPLVCYVSDCNLVLVSGLLIAEVTLNAMRLEGRPSNGLLAMVESTLGLLGARIAGGAYLFLHYALLVAYVAQGGEILVSAASQLWGGANVLPAWVGTTTFTLLFGGIMYLGRERFVEKLNSALVAIVIVRDHIQELFDQLTLEQVTSASSYDFILEALFYAASH